MQFQLILLLMSVVLSTSAYAADSCRDCHENSQKMAALGYGQFVVTQQEVEAQSRMPAGCSSCHLGNAQESEKDAAHKGMARLLVVRKKGLTADTSPRKFPLEFGTNQANRVYAVTEINGKKTRDSSVATLSWHDKRTDTLTQDFEVMKKTCGACHEKEFNEFSKSTMGINGKQSQYRGWTNKQRGPHNCGPWFEGAFDLMQTNTALPMDRKSQVINQKACNTCHVGCLDCHFNPMAKSSTDSSMGSHTFAKTPPVLSCYGNGRASICHAGPEDRRRGAGYFGGSFSYPEGNEPDVHLTANVGCLDCHDNSKSDKSLGHGMVKRQADGSCKRCHPEAVKSHAGSLHKKLSCEACHIQRVAGYQGTYWGPGKLAGTETPYFKYKAYYGIMPEPILIKDQKGRWIPVKPFPMAALNQISSPYKPGLHWRFPAKLPDLQRTDDAWAYVGLFGGLPENNKALLWIQMDKLSHKLGKSRSCDSCHGDPQGVQHQPVTWDYSDPGAAPFSGSHTVVGDKKGLSVRDMRSEKIEPDKGVAISSFAPWVYLKDAWQVRGDFSLPTIRDRKTYDRIRNSAEAARAAGVLHSK
ncbi:MAG: cytochrome c3 family protein [Desulfuromonadaceae bacterium]|nr:cytochrome c3 family protein [Desulfuromonadaceae bacterium]MDD2849213.1 cytochrome c3 family protein [Desulfuromonadaceae bacterium]MDD4129738.1 cytochrome c3 family protein [Desulfuromonadaceae bacterium]